MQVKQRIYLVKMSASIEQRLSPIAREDAEEICDILSEEKAAPQEVPTEEEKKSWWRRFIEWIKRLPAEIKSKISSLELDMDGALTIDDLLSIRKMVRLMVQNCRGWH